MQALKRFVLICSVFASFVCEARVETTVIDVNGVQRSYRLFVPEDYTRGKSSALVFDLHGSGGNPEGQSRNSALEQLAAAQRFIVVHPAGVYVRAPNTGVSWNVDLDPRGVDDVQFIRALVASLKQRYSIDPQRIFATGFSGGARMSSRLACDMSDTFAAVALVGGVRFPEKCTPATPVAVLAIHAEDDAVNHFHHQPDSPPYWPVGVMDAVAQWARQNGCSAAPRVEKIKTELTRFTFEQCTPGAEVVLITSKRGGHSWPGSPLLTPDVADKFQGLSATQELWQFFISHPKRSQSTSEHTRQ